MNAPVGPPQELLRLLGNRTIPEEVVDRLCAGLALISGMAGFAILTNFFLTLTLLREKVVRLNQTYYTLLIGLICADFQLAVGIGIASIRKFLYFLYHESVTPRLLGECAFYEFCTFGGTMAQIILTFLIALERCYVVAFPLHYHKKGRLILGRFSIWTVAVVYAISWVTAAWGLHDLQLGHLSKVDMGPISVNPNTAVSPQWYLSAYNKASMTLVCLTVLAYVLLLVFVKLLRPKLRRTGATVTTIKNIEKKQRQTTSFILWLIAMYTVTFALATIINYVKLQLTPTAPSFEYQLFSAQFGLFSVALKMVNTIGNIVLYPWKDPQIRSAILEKVPIIGRYLQKQVEPEPVVSVIADNSAAITASRSRRQALNLDTTDRMNLGVLSLHAI